MVDISESDWSTCLYFTHKSFISGYAQEKNYKVLSRWYRDPMTLHKMFPTASKACWRCGDPLGTYVHVWWECPNVTPFWDKIFTIYNDLYDLNLSPSPEIALLALLRGPRKKYRSLLLCYFLSAARQMVPLYWKQNKTPQISTWISCMNNIVSAEELLARDSDTTDPFITQWSIWSYFIHTKAATFLP